MRKLPEQMPTEFAVAEHAQQDLLKALQEYEPGDAEEENHRHFIIRHVLQYPRPFDRAHLHGHLTGSALVISHDFGYVLLGLHRKLGKWLQMGGHGEPGETSVESVAMREALEESGIPDLILYQPAPRPFDIDVHTIPERPGIPEHLHLDLRYLLIAPGNAQPVTQIEEQETVRWFTWEEVMDLDLDHSLQRAIRKARSLTALRHPAP